ncbi:putative RING-H2 finger protein ATL12 [Lolium perenne]|jgi:E3 ubiquitin-protein ligase ATL6/9/15/31/42/55|uniref:putative RING-H2 finger protein ATL12 n=1 Tax=Lolium perenne TaxID=4522 RepID=UPI0021EAA43A|nr:putative RING-H2 finger protein ATL12 [Lolium perenne]
MAKIILLLLVAALTFLATQAQAQPASSGGPEPTGVGIKVSFRPSVAIVVGIFTMIFSLTFLLLMYAKFCHNSSSPPLLPTTTNNSPGRMATAVDAEANSGVGKGVIESLPFFRFAALRGARQGLECAVCLARFDDADLLRLLPRCRHAFHLDCVDRWLATSASCPLCRARVHADDADLGLKYAAASARFVFGAAADDHPTPVVASGSMSGRDLTAGIFVERVPSSRFGVGVAGENSNDLDRHRHRIVVSDVVFKSRWSDLSSADLLALDTEMLRSFSSGHLDLDVGQDIVFVGHHATTTTLEDSSGTVEKKRLLEKGDLQQASSSASIRGCGSSGARSMSEIVRLPRVARPMARTEEERRWAPIARRTARWFAVRQEGGGRR